MALAQNLTLIRRFSQAVREDGPKSALRKSRGYLGLRLRHVAPSILSRKEATPVAAQDRYLQGVWGDLSRQKAFHIAQAPAVHRKRRHIALIGDLNLPQCRKYRAEQLVEFWEARGVRFEYAHYQDIPRAVRIMQHATHLMAYRLCASPLVDMLLYEARRLRLPVLYDLDDPLFSVSAYETYGNMAAVDPALKGHFISEAPKYLSVMNAADALSLSTPGLVDHAGLYSARPAFLRRNFADAETLDCGAAVLARRREADGLFRVAFASGSQGHEADLDEILAPLLAFIQGHPNRRLLVLGHFDKTRLPARLLPQLETVGFRDYPDYLDALGEADCAVMPLGRDLFNHCKSGVRVIDAAAVGVPVIAADVGDLSALVEHGKTGFVARNGAGWEAALATLAADPAGARQMGLAARRNLEETWACGAEGHLVTPELLKWVDGS